MARVRLPIRDIKGLTGVKMLFARETAKGLAVAAALVNTLDGEHDGLSDVDALEKFARAWGWAGPRRPNVAQLRSVRALRLRLREVWEADEPRVVEIVNRILRDVKALPQLVKRSEPGYQLCASPDSCLADRIAVDAAMALADLICGKQLRRLRICDYPACDAVLVDLSKNGSRLYCEGTCGNRAAVAAYRARRAVPLRVNHTASRTPAAIMTTMTGPP